MPVDVLLIALWNLRWRLLGTMAATLLLGASLILLWPRQYVAEAVVAPAETTGLATSTLLQGALVMPGGLLDTRPGGNFAVYLATLRSPEATAMLARETSILADLTARKAAGVTGRLRALLGLDAAEADLDDVQRWLEGNLAVTPSLSTVTTALSLPHPDRTAALAMLERLHGFAEARVRADLEALATRRMAALEARLANERDLYVRTPIFELLAQHQRAAVITRADDSVAARLVSPPSVGIAPALPNRPLLLLLLAVTVPMACVTLAACWVLLRGAAPAAPLRPSRGGRPPSLAIARGPEE
ncbi:hypothetical protein [Muricoccus radiodurans]|uniref:hypothetical protein n=1 Tax=Muricoccus radiodurans TaxID=2231721 RepID=UPI003CE6FEB6